MIIETWSHFYILMSYLGSTEKRFKTYASTNGADQSAHSRRLICAIVVSCLYSMMVVINISVFFNIDCSLCSLADSDKSYLAGRRFPKLGSSCEVDLLCSCQLLNAK